MTPAYFQAAALVSGPVIIPPIVAPPTGGSEGSGFDFIVSTSPYTPPSGDRVDFTTT